jgi:hypothetical protein
MLSKLFIVVFYYLLATCSLTFSQSLFPDKNVKIQQLKSRENIKVTEIEKGIYKIQYSNGNTLFKNTNDYRPAANAVLKYSPTYDSTIIDLRTIDTTLYYRKYSYWQEVPLTNLEFSHIMVDDVNENNKPELYGARKFLQSEQEPVTIYELNNSYSFEYVYQYDSVYIDRQIYDVDSDGDKEVMLALPLFYPDLPIQERFFSKSSNNSLATNLNFIFPDSDIDSLLQLNDLTLGNFDGDVKTDLAYTVSSWPDVHIYEYNPINNNFDSVYRFDTDETPPIANSGFSVGDFDLDGKTDLVFGTGQGHVYVLENEGDNQYANTWQGMVETYHAYVHTWSNDIDNNGKPEFWELGDAYYNGIGITRITIFETDGDNSYQAVGKIDLIGVISFYAGTMQAIDVDGDGTEEIAICIDDFFLILKFNGNRNHQIYEVYYIKQNELSLSGQNSVYYGATMFDLLNKGDENILISMDQIVYQGGNGNIRFFTQIYRPDSVTNVIKSNNFIKRFELFQNYPNPFNPVTEIKFNLASQENVLVNVYNILGKEIKLLVKEELPAGEHKVQWGGKDNYNRELPSGIYFIKMTAGSYQKTIKAILLK